MNNYYLVTCKCGHVGIKHYIPITFPVIASSKKEAASKARSYPRCKHHHKDCVLDVTLVSYDEFKSAVVANNNDEYLKCTNSSDQRKIDLSSRIMSEPTKEYREKEISNKLVYRNKKAIKYPKKYLRFNPEKVLNY